MGSRSCYRGGVHSQFFGSFGRPEMWVFPIAPVYGVPFNDATRAHSSPLCYCQSKNFNLHPMTFVQGLLETSKSMKIF